MTEKTESVGDKIERLVDLCEGEVIITFNEHTTNYETVEQALARDYLELYDGIDDGVKAEMIRSNSMVCAHAYPDTPIGSYRVTHWSLDAALDLVLSAIEESR